MSAAAALVIRLAVVNSMARISLLAIESMKYLKGEMLSRFMPQMSMLINRLIFFIFSFVSLSVVIIV